MKHPLWTPSIDHPKNSIKIINKINKIKIIKKFKNLVVTIDLLCRQILLFMLILVRVCYTLAVLVYGHIGIYMGVYGQEIIVQLQKIITQSSSFRFMQVWQQSVTLFSLKPAFSSLKLLPSK